MSTTSFRQSCWERHIYCFAAIFIAVQALHHFVTGCLSTDVFVVSHVRLVELLEGTTSAWLLIPHEDLEALDAVIGPLEFFFAVG